MLVDTEFSGRLHTAGTEAENAEAAGYEAIWSTDSANDPFLPLAVSAERTQRISLGTGIAVAFARSPMTVAQTAWNLQALSGGRMVLGLGSQIQPHIERRFSMPWSRPAGRMHEYISALRAIWACWQDGTKLEFSGEFYTHNLMPPHFNPGPVTGGPPPVFLAAVGESMTRVAAEAADGILLHRFTTPRYLRQATLPALAAGRRGRKTLSPIQVVLPVFIVIGDTDAELAAGRAATRKQLAFYSSTPAYRPVLDAHGWGELQPELQSLTRQNRWSEMDALITDEMLTEFTAIGSPEQAAKVLQTRFGGLIDRLAPTAVYDLRPGLRNRLATALRS
ncbi:TIGR03617 family F420-dependent LLM class oxidoreductase [Sporichthya sp.]|uniref:TIGR03617 family F420-dependent LLM class oxidoreductase n=1 Tax=Sporichthya sp. TaxID=65475 RepID=UPI0017A01002|nr:TIGR03617 family F420-dependent LLM class oxidoreductase [Sporichthya sp.]MBA3742893.1 TIGR03617 family F420-dependent LLM class oxidoreductase [Sporichthya sp.]